MKDIANYSLKAHNTFGIDVRCRRFLQYRSEEEAQTVARILRESGDPYIIIGRGSNLLLTRDFDGIVVRSAINIAYEDVDRVLCGSGVEWDVLVEKLVSHGLYGAENLSLIPGDVGAAAVQNIGAYGAEAKDVIERVWAVEIATGELCLFMNDQLDYGYRYSSGYGRYYGRYYGKYGREK